VIADFDRKNMFGLKGEEEKNNQRMKERIERMKRVLFGSRAIPAARSFVGVGLYW
jgi:hypothetical protein